MSKLNQKKIPQTDAIFDNLKTYSDLPACDEVKRISLDCKATIKLGDYSRGGQTRGDNHAQATRTYAYDPAGNRTSISDQLFVVRPIGIALR